MYKSLACHENAGQDHDINIANRVLQCVTVQIFGKDS
jgi:hypothetical protein